MSTCRLTVSVHAFFTDQFRRGDKLPSQSRPRLRGLRDLRGPRSQICHTEDRARPGTHNTHCRRLASVVCAIDKEAREQQTGFHQPLSISKTSIGPASDHPLWIAVPCWLSLAMGGQVSSFSSTRTCHRRDSSMSLSNQTMLGSDRPATHDGEGRHSICAWIVSAEVAGAGDDAPVEFFVRAWVRGTLRAMLISRGSFLATELEEGETTTRDGLGDQP